MAIKFIVLAGLLLLAGCSSDKPETSVRSTPRPAAEVRAASALALGTDGKVGELDISVIEVTPATLDVGQPEPGEGWVLVRVTVFNRSDEAQNPPDFNLSCGGSFGDRYIYEEDGAFSFEPLPANSYESGAVLFSAPLSCPKGLIRAFPLGAYIDVDTPKAEWAFEYSAK
jgi:hypothetical protein